jgi:hypothetical protein
MYMTTPDSGELRSERISVSLTPAVLEALRAWGRANHWTASTAANVLIERGLAAEARDREATR